MVTPFSAFFLFDIHSQPLDLMHRLGTGFLESVRPVKALENFGLSSKLLIPKATIK